MARTLAAGGCTSIGPVARTPRDVVTQLRLGKGREPGEWGRVVFLIGAGCSASAGVPLGKRVAQMCALDTARRLGAEVQESGYEEQQCEIALRWLCDKEYLPRDTTWAHAYASIFEHLLTDPTLQKQAIARALALGEGKINWTHMVLGHMVSHKYVSTVLTTNFDQLVLQGLILAGVLPVVADGVESLSRIDPKPSTPQVVHLHGSLHTYQMRNSRRDLQEIGENSMVISALTGLLHEAAALVVVGYAGGEEGIMRVITNAVRDLGAKNVFWVRRADDPSQLSPHAAELLEVARLGGVVAIQDSDGFFKDMAQQLGIGSPDWLRSPIHELKVRAKNFAASEDPDIRAEMEDYSGLLGGLVSAFDRLRQQQREQERIESALKDARDLRLKGDFEGALEILDGLVDQSPEVCEQVGELHFELAQSTDDQEHLAAALGAYDRALQSWTRDSNPERWATVQMRRGDLLRVVGLRTGDVEKLCDALAVHLEAYRVFDQRSARRLTQLVKGSILDDVESLRERDHPYAQRRLEAVADELTQMGVLPAQPVRPAQ